MWRGRWERESEALLFRVVALDICVTDASQKKRECTLHVQCTFLYTAHAVYVLMEEFVKFVPGLKKAYIFVHCTRSVQKCTLLQNYSKIGLFLLHKLYHEY